ncbi:MAG: hypothetical protein GY774_35095 [Planctomycetes bacterium]|nr:hypothetical protein [Planctomycetota bacterium]
MTATATLAPAKELIEMTRVVLDDNEMYVSNDHTLFINQRPLSHFLPETNAANLIANLKQAYQDAIRIARENGVKVGYRLRYKREIEALEAVLAPAIEKALALYPQMKTGWEAKLEKGIYVGYVDDTEVDALSALKWEYEALFYHSAPIGKAMDLIRHLNDAKTSAAHPDCIKISL